MGRKSAELGNRKENSSFSSPSPSFRSNLWSWASRIYYMKSRLPAALSDFVTDQIISFMLSIHNLWLLADWHTGCLNLHLLSELDSSGFTLRSVALEQNPMCDLSGLTTGNYKALPGRPHGGSCFPTPGLVHSQCTVVIWRELSQGLRSSGTSHAHLHTCIPSPGAFIWSPLYQGTLAETLSKHCIVRGPWLRKFSQYLFTPSLSLSPLLPSCGPTSL